MSLTKTEAFVINGFRYGDNGKIVTFYTKDYGKLSGVVKGIRNSRGNASGKFDNMNRIELYFNKKENRSLQTIGNSEFIETYPKIKSDLDKISSAYRILELVNKTTEEYDTNENIYFLLKEVFDELEICDANTNVLTLYFFIKYSVLTGLDYTGISDGTFCGNSEFNSISGEEKRILNLLSSDDFDNKNITGVSDESVGNLQNFYDSTFMNYANKLKNFKTIKVLNQIKKDY